VTRGSDVSVARPPTAHPQRVPKGLGDLFTFRLYLESGEDIGFFTTPVPDWSRGQVFFAADRFYRIITIAGGEHLANGHYDGLFKVTPVGSFDGLFKAAPVPPNGHQ